MGKRTAPGPTRPAVMSVGRGPSGSMPPALLQEVLRPTRSLVIASVLASAFIPGCGPDAAWNCDIGLQRCQDGVNQVCVLDHADTSQDETITTYIGRWVDRGACP